MNSVAPSVRRAKDVDKTVADADGENKRQWNHARIILELKIIISNQIPNHFTYSLA